MAEINLFTGGINRHKDARKLDLNELTSVVDGEISSGSVVSLARPILYKSGVNPVFIEYKDDIVSGSGEYLKYAKSLNYLFRCNGEKPQYTAGTKDVKGNLEWNTFGLDPVSSTVSVENLSATMVFTNTGLRGTSEIATYNYIAVLDRGVDTERVCEITFECTEAGKQFSILPSSIDKSYSTLELYRKYSSNYYRLTDGNPILDFVEIGGTNVNYPEIIDAKFTYISPRVPAVPAGDAWYGTLFRADGNGNGRLWTIAYGSLNHKGSYEWSDIEEPHFIDEFNFSTGVGPNVGATYLFRGLNNNYLFASVDYVGKELVNGKYVFTFDFYQNYGFTTVRYFMYRISFSYYYQSVIALEDIVAAKADTSMPIIYRKTEPTTYLGSLYQEFFYVSSTSGLRSSSVSMDFTKILDRGINGSFQYTLTYLDTFGQETAAGDYSTPINTNNGSIEVTIPLPVNLDPTITAVNVYRMNTSIYGGQTSFLLVKSFPISSLPTTFVDTKQISELGGIIPVATLTTVPDDILFLTSYTGRLFAATKDLSETTTVKNDYTQYLTVRWSEVGKPLTWLGNSWLNMDSPITGIGTSSNGLIIFSLTETFALLGTESEPFTHRLLSSSQGCVDFRSIQNWQGNCIFASVEGICMSNGGSVDLVSYAKLGLLNTLSVDNSAYKSVTDSEIISSAVVGNTYFLQV